jgi:hypothetical protein
MAIITPCADLRNNYNEIFYKEYPDFESFKKDVYEKIEIGLKQVKEGKYTPAEEFFKEMEEKYDL